MLTVEFDMDEFKYNLNALTYAEFKIWVAIKLRIMDMEVQNAAASDWWPCVVKKADLVDDTEMSFRWIVEATKSLVEKGFFRRRIDRVTRAWVYTEPRVLPYQVRKRIRRAA